MTDDLLDRLAHVEVGTRTPDLASVERRSHVILRRRRSVRAGAIGLAVVVTVALGAILPLDRQSDAPLAQVGGPLALGALPASAGTGERSCDTAFTSRLPRTDWAAAPDVVESASLITDPPAPLTRLEVVHDDLSCPETVPAAVLYDSDPVRGISVWPDVQDPFAGIEDIPDEDPLASVLVDGHDALLRDFGRETLQVSWLAADGTRWMAMSSGFTMGDALTVLDDLRFDGSDLDPTSVPADLTVSPVSTVPPSTTVRTWTVVYGDETEHVVESPVTTLRATTAYAAPIEVSASMNARGTRFVEVNGRPAVLNVNSPDLDLPPFGWLEWTRDGVSYILVAWGTCDEIVALAEKVERVSLDDSRVTGAPGPEDAPG